VKNHKLLFLEAVQQSKSGRERKINRALNPKRSKNFGAKSDYNNSSKTLKLKYGGRCIGFK
jgi:hypothetical protein